MAHIKPVLMLTLAGTVLLSACASTDSSGLLNLRSTGAGPDEFAILPTKPLELPSSLTSLPAPTPGATNLTDPTPNLDASVALGGNARAINQSGIPKSDQGIISATGRFGTAPDIRTALARTDDEFRRTHRGKILERLFGVSRYFTVYEQETLDRYAELRRLRLLGVRTPAAPPQTTN